MHAQSTSPVDIAPYERYLATLHVPDSLKAGLAYDDDDVRNECRLVAYNAIVRFRERGGPRDEEARYVRRSVKNHFIDTIRRAERQCRCPDATAIGTIQTSAHGTTSFDVEAGHGSVEVALLEDERRASLQRAARAIRSELGEVAYRQALLRVDGEGWSGIVSDAERNAAKCRYRRSLVRARHFLGADTLEDVERRFGGTMPAEMEIDKLTDDNLARVAIVHGVSVEKMERDHLIAQVRAINTDHESGASYGFPPCFASEQEYDPGDAACAEECDFRVECSACIPQYRSDVVETTLVQLRSKVVAKPKPEPAPPAEPASDPKLVVKADKPAADKKAKKATKAKPAAEPEQKPTAELYRAEKWPPEEKAAAHDEFDEPAAPEAPTEAAAPQAKAAKKSSSKKKAASAAKKPEAESTPVVGVFLSERRGVFRKGQKDYKLRPDGSRWYRAPSGSAAELAYLPVGHERTRDWNGYRYHVVKIKDGPTRQMPSGELRKRDGVWRLDWRAKFHANGELGEKQVFKKPMEDSLGKITFHITDNRAWSAARFFTVLPPQLDRSSKAFNPNTFAPNSPYRYEGGEGAPAPAKKAAKSSTKKKAAKKAAPVKAAKAKAAPKKAAAKKKTKVVVKAKPKAPAKKAAKKKTAKAKVVVKKKQAKKAAKKRAA